MFLQVTKFARQFSLLVCFFWLSQPSAMADTPYVPCSGKINTPLNILSSGWSREYTQQRVYDQEQAGMTAGDLAALEVAWTFVYKDSHQPRSLPAVTSQVVYVGSDEGAVYALDTNTGCGYWRFQGEEQVRTAVSVAKVSDRWLVFFGDKSATAYAVDAISGEQVWKRKLDDVSFSVITGSPVFYNDTLFVPVSSWEVGLAVNPFYSCCKFRGALVSVNALTGELNWKSYTITEPLKPSYRNALGIQQYGPSGAGIWSAPTIDQKRQRIYVGTGQNYSSPANNTSDSILAFDLPSGKLLWSKQVLPEDAWNAVCSFGWLGINCPKERGNDYDFGAPPILVTRADGKDVIIGGTKGGMAYAFDPDNNGEILWQESIGRGGVIGGIHWGMAATTEHVYVPMADSDAPLLAKTPGEPKPGLTKLDINTGKTLWHTSTSAYCIGKEKCRSGLSAAITVIPGAVLAPVLDGILRAYSTEDGKLLWQFDSTSPVSGINGVKGHGGTLDVGGVVATNGMLFFNSGYGGLISSGGSGGNVFWVLRIRQLDNNSD